MIKKVAAFLALFFVFLAFAHAQVVTTARDAQGGWELHVNGQRFFVRGVSWATNPPGTHYVFNLWNESPDTIRRVIDHDAQMMIAAGVNAVRVGPGIPRMWVEYLFNMYGIHTIIHDVFGRWGTSANGRFYRPTNYFLPHIREQIRRNSLAIVEYYRDVSGVLMYMFGEANGDGLYWSGDDDHPDIIARFGTNPMLRRGNALFSLLEEVFAEAKQIDPNRPFAFVNNDLGWLPVIAEMVPSMDILAVNMTRGAQAGSDFWNEARTVIDRPIILTSLGSDAWNARLNREDQYHQAMWITSQWRDLYANSYGHGVSIGLGGVVNEWTDQWFTNDFDSWERAGIHDTAAVFANPGFSFDYVPGRPNINPEWMGITRQGPRTIVANFRERLPRASFFALQQIWSVNPWQLAPPPGQVTTTTTVNEAGETVTVTQTVPGVGVSPELEAHFAQVDLGRHLARGMQDSWEPRPVWGVRNSLTFTSMMTGHGVGRHLRRGGNFFDAFRDRPFPVDPEADNILGYPGGPSNIDPSIPVGHQYGAELQTTLWGMGDLGVGGYLEAEVTVVLRHDRGASQDPGQTYGPIWSLLDRSTAMGLATRPVDIHSGWFRWTGFGAEVHGFFHSGRGGWMGRGDFFNFALEAWDTHTGDLWNTKAPMGVQVTHGIGLGANQGFSVLAGPRVFAGASPMIIAMWNHDLPDLRAGHMFRYSVALSQEFSSHNTDFLHPDFPNPEHASWEAIIPPTHTRAATRASLWFSWEPEMTDTSSLVAQAGIMASNVHMIGDFWRVMDGGSAREGEIDILDALAFKARVEYSPIQHFGVMAEIVYAGLVANTNWHPHDIGSLLGDIGIGNRMEVKGGVAGSFGNFSAGLNALWRQPLVGPAGVDLAANVHPAAPYGVPGQNHLYRWNPFRVGENRETLALEFIFAFDMEPGSWIWWWNNLDTENSLFATTIVARYSIFEGATDPGFWRHDTDILAWYDRGFSEIRGNYEIVWRKFFNPNNDFRVVNTLTFSRGHYAGLFNGCYEAGREVISGWSNALQMRYRRFIAGGSIARNLWGGPGYHFDWNFTFPWQWSLEFAFAFTPRPSLMESTNRIGIRWNGATRDQFSHNAWGLLPSDVDTQEIVLFFNITF